MRYIGCKTLLLNDIERVVEENINEAESFCDIFSGTVTVAKFFKPKYKIISNDILGFSYSIQKAIIESNSQPDFETLYLAKNIKDPILYFNSLQDKELENLKQEKRFFQNNYSPKGNRMYLSDSNALRIDFIRTTIENWYKELLINESEYYYLLSALINAVPSVSNISGTYGAYNKIWDKRAYKTLTLKKIEIYDNKKENKAYNKDGNSLIKEIEGDILYIDPPYNSRQYSSNYHLLETVALYDLPVLKGVTGLRDESTKKSKYCQKSNVKSEFEDLIKNAKFKHIIMSYSNEGLLETKEIENILKKYGDSKTFKLYEIPYRRFKSRETEAQNQLKELLFYVRKSL